MTTNLYGPGSGGGPERPHETIDESLRRVSQGNPAHEPDAEATALYPVAGADALRAERDDLRADVARLERAADEYHAENAALRSRLEAVEGALRILRREAARELHGGMPEPLLRACHAARAALETAPQQSKHERLRDALGVKAGTNAAIIRWLTGLSCWTVEAFYESGCEWSKEFEDVGEEMLGHLKEALV